MSTAEASRKFHFIREIASGGFGSVFLAKVVHSDGFSRLVAIKLLHARWSENEEVASRMRDEARLLGWLRHKNIVEVLDLTLIDSRCAVIMEYLEAVDAKVIVSALHETGALVPLRAALEICAAVASALDAAYNRPPYAGEKPLRVIHRDIKPSNIMVDGSGVVKVLDFGVARAEFDQREAHTQELTFGSLEYMPPERLFFEPESPSSDVYSLGVTLFEILSADKFGKAKLRPDDQQRFIAERFDQLFDIHRMPSKEIEDEVYDLMADMLAFDATERPSASDCVVRMRNLARRLNQVGLEEWAEKVVPQIVVRFHETQLVGDNPLVNQVVTEDPRGFGQNTDSNSSPMGRGETTGDIRGSLNADPETDEIGNSAKAQDEAKWRDLKLRTMSDLDDEEVPAYSVPPPRAPSNPPKAGPPQKPVSQAPTPLKAPPQPPKAPSGSPAGRTLVAPSMSDEDAPQKVRSVTLVALPPELDDEEEEVPTKLDVPRKMPSQTPSPAPSPEPEPISESMRTPTPAPATGRRPKKAKGAPAPAPRTSWASWIMLFLLIAGVVFVGVMVFGIFGGALGVKFIMDDEVPIAPAPAPSPGPSAKPEPKPAPAEPAPSVAPEPKVEAPKPAAPAPAKPAKPTPAGGGTEAKFVSAFPNTKKMTVRCTNGEGNGVGEAVVTSASPGDCRVTAIDKERNRVNATVKGAKAVTYTCFENGEETCK